MPKDGTRLYFCLPNGTDLQFVYITNDQLLFLAILPFDWLFVIFCEDKSLKKLWQEML
jgi:hypothetical protein